MNPVFWFIQRYWSQLAIALACLIVVSYINILRHENNALRSDNASLKANIVEIKAMGEKQNAETSRIDEGSHKAVLAQAEMYTTDQQKLKDYYAHHPVTVTKYVVGSVQRPASGSGTCQVPDFPITAEESTANGADADTVPSGSGLEEQCAETTLAYNILRQAWDDVCKEANCN